MRSWIAVGVAMLLAMPAGTAVAADASEAQVRELLGVIGINKVLAQMETEMSTQVTTTMGRTMPCVPASYWSGFFSSTSQDELIHRMIPIYQHHLSAEDIQGLIAFYRSPLGQKMITVMPQTMAEGMQVGRQWGQERAIDMINHLRQKGTLDANGRCPAAGSGTALTGKS
ncbi:DUF2059 domain-containing protein [Dyella sp. ASV21]|jgi:hypothetical protein|uniref:DUF2059 domain-containing protein n=1 Tax=Dyella sp. ASV21 TaxID=2795114 RepID=UPI0018ED4957|nr:DUF2059 domain-containing protein [Dyella sp. ASV21]